MTPEDYALRQAMLVLIDAGHFKASAQPNYVNLARFLGYESGNAKEFIAKWWRTEGARLREIKRLDRRSTNRRAVPKADFSRPQRTDRGIRS